MKYLVSLMFSGLLLCSSLTAQNLANNGPRILDEVSVVTSTVEDGVTEIGTRELFVMENSTNDYTRTTWSKEIYRQVGKEVTGNETFFFPEKSTKDEANLFSVLVNLISTNTVHVYKYNPQPEMDEEYILKGKTALEESAIPFTESENGVCQVKMEDIPSDKIAYYLVKERWYFDSKTNKGDIRVTHICPVLFEKGKYFPLFWVSFDDISVYLARAASYEYAAETVPSYARTSMFDIIANKRYRGCIYQVGLRHLSAFFPKMEDLINERARIENELDYIQSRFYDVARKHKEYR